MGRLGLCIFACNGFGFVVYTGRARRCAYVAWTCPAVSSLQVNAYGRFETDALTGASGANSILV